MQFALCLARRGRGRTDENPSVGAIIVDPATGEILGAARTSDHGRPHAETQAIQMAGARAKGAVLYVTLEPCSHQGQTPPCCQAIIDAGIARVVYGMLDPNPIVAGRGIKALTNCGIETIACDLDGDIFQAHLAQTLRFVDRRPKILLKLALSHDGKILTGVGTPRWVTGSLARRHGQLLRLETDAILIGGETLRADDPTLTCRLSGLAAFSPKPIVLFGRKPVPLKAALLNRTNGPQPLCFVAHGTTAMQDLSKAKIDVIAVDETEEARLNLGQIVSHLHEQTIKSVLVEGGPQIGQSFLAAGLVDEVHLYRSEETLGNKGQAIFGLDDGTPPTFAHYLKEHGLQMERQKQLGTDSWQKWVLPYVGKVDGKAACNLSDGAQ